VQDSAPEGFLVSIVIPVARMAGRLDNLRQSLLGIPKSGVEVILVDDQQDEETGLELSELISKVGNNHIRKISGKFGNPGAARNAGLAVSSGSWVTFWDSDDIGFVDAILSELKYADTEVKCIIGQYQHYSVTRKETFTTELIDNLSQIPKSPGIWRFVFRKEKLKAFRDLSMGEDQVFIAENLQRNDTVRFSQKCFYKYITGNTFQLTTSKSKISDLRTAVRIISNLRKSEIKNDSKFLLEMNIRIHFAIIKYDSYHHKLRSVAKISMLLPKLLFSFRTTKGSGHSRVKSSVTVSMTGGLGNQLFQLAAANFYAGSQSPNAVFGFGIPRRTISGVPDILEFNTEKVIKRQDTETVNWFFSKLAGYNLRMGITVRRYENNRVIKSLISTVSNLLFSMHFRKRTHVLRADGVGYCDLMPMNKHVLLFGYLQSYRWVMQPGVIEKFRELDLLAPSTVVNSRRSEGGNSRILGIHIRLGDYKSESNFGILSPDYYQGALAKLLMNSSFDKIWIFSDEPKLARTIHTFSSALPTEWIDDGELTAAETLQIFRRCDGFILANSTFGWWAAMLSDANNPVVAVPSKWFKDLEDPHDLIPPSWVRVPAPFLSSEEVSNLID
jgi:glycosyltransferase involved in cell wall biosynthesis